MKRRSFIAAGLAAALFAAPAFAADITGAGATFPYPIYAKWADAYRKSTGVGLNYQSIGSGGGIKQITSKTVDFGASDMPMKAEDLEKNGLLQFPAIMGGVVLLYNTGSWSLALVVLVASVMVPLGKLIALAYLLISVQRGVRGGARERTRLYRMVEFIGRWSMLDIFVVTILVALVQLNTLATIKAGPAAAAFGAVVVLTMSAARTFDPRLIWDCVGGKRG